MIDKNYVERQIKAAESAPTEEQRNDCLYRAGTQMEILPPDGNTNLTVEQQQQIISAARGLNND